MNKNIIRNTIFTLFLSTIMLASSVLPTLATQPTKHVDDFELTDNHLMAYQLSYYKYLKAVVVMTYTKGVSDASANSFQIIANSYKNNDVLFLMLDPTDKRDSVTTTLPTLIDETQLVSSNFGVTKEGEVYVVSPQNGTVLYQGTVAGSGQAIDSIINNRPIRTAFIENTYGKPIQLAPKLKNISYSKDVAPILQEKCVVCHLSGGIGPFTLDSYDKVKGMSPTIREVIRTRRMPPYFADPHIGTFKNSQGLTAEQSKTIVQWIENGSPRGEGNDPLLINKDRVAPEWPEELGKPDVVIDLPAFTVPATGVIQYQNQVVANPFKDDTWLRAIAIKPGDRRVLHHVVSSARPAPGKPADIPSGSVGSYTPGARPQIMADDAGAPVPGGGTMSFQMHYTTFGTEVTDHTQVGFYVSKTLPKYIKRSIVISNSYLTIPAGDARHKEVSYITFPADAYLYTLYPHAHYRGMHVELKRINPDGTQEMLLALPKYDFNWQRDYDPAEPILVKAGTKLVATWVYDNSIHNSANPDPTKTVTWGEQTFNEMMYFRINYRFADETTSNIRNDLQSKLSASLALGSLDTNLDGKVQVSELRGQMTRLAPMFSMYDRNGDGGLDANELAAANVGGRGRGPATVEIPDL